RRSGQALYNEVVKADAIKPRLTLSKALVFVIAALVHLITLAFFVVGLGVIIGGWPKPLLILGGAVCLVVAAGLRPRLPKPHGAILPREDAPTLYQVADGVAQVLGATPIDAIVIDGNFNAAFGTFGWRQKSVLYLGLPLISILECQELVA